MDGLACFVEPEGLIGFTIDAALSRVRSYGLGSIDCWLMGEEGACIDRALAGFDILGFSDLKELACCKGTLAVSRLVV